MTGYSIFAGLSFIGLKHVEKNVQIEFNQTVYLDENVGVIKNIW